MGSKMFSRDLALATETTFGNASNVRRGDLEDGISFVFSHQYLETPIEVEVVIQDVTVYARNASFMAFTSSECLGTADIAGFLQKLSPYIPSNSAVSDIVTFVSNRLIERLVTTADGANLSGDEFDNDEKLGLGDDSFPDTETGGETGNGGNPTTLTDPSATLMERSELGTLKRALQRVQAAGVSVGLLPAVRGRVPRVVSLSIRVSQLGLSDDALEAWGLEADEHLVLLLRCAQGLPSLQSYLKLPFDQEDVQFRFGKCATAKPSMGSARIAFFRTSGDSSLNETEMKDTSDTPASCDAGFFPIHMSGSINRQLNGFLHKLLALRRSYSLSWNSAQDALYAMQRTPGFEIPPPDDKENVDGPIIGPQAPAALQSDCVFDDDEQFSIPLAAMQLALRQLARCTEFCMACYGRLEDGPGALKPYVCADPLCLYQYLSLGFGPSIENEIINDPYVVDLLISFFYSAVRYGLLREFPAGLALKAPAVHDPVNSIVALAKLAVGEFCIGPDGKGTRHSIGTRDWVVLVTTDTKSIECHVCRITDVRHQTYSFEILSGPFTPNTEARALILNYLVESGAEQRLGWHRALVFPFSHDLGSISVHYRDSSLTLILCGIPSVLDMRAYLLKRPGRQLSSWERMNRSSLILLDWIVASNRSLIVQGQQLVAPEVNAKQTQSLFSPTLANQRVGGLLQLRFAQGAPDKERQFMHELEKHTMNSEGKRQEFPSIFAWHGSPFGNWHSIIRTGLDFQRTTHGRAYGNGVYLSWNMALSNGYSQARGSVLDPDGPQLPTQWGNSQLRPCGAISLCEVVNRPDKFVSSSPHYVVDQVEWIQCRYLYVNVDPTDMALADPFPGRQYKSVEGFVAQDDSRQLIGMCEEPFQVPLAAVPACRRGGLTAWTRAGTSAEQHEPKTESPSGKRNDFDSGDDIELLNTFDTGGVEPQGNKRRRDSMSGESLDEPAKSIRRLNDKMSEDSDIDMETGEAMEGIEETSVVFRPGTLDHSSLPKLPVPSWATSSPHAVHCLSREVQDLHKIQCRTAASELGWYVDVNKIDNLFHWMAELHSFDAALPLTQDMAHRGCTSIVLEVRFGANFPISPPFVRVLRPRFLPFAQGGGGHVTSGGAICSELLTHSGWSPAVTMEKVLLQVRLGLCDLDPPARLDGRLPNADYGIAEAAAAYRRAVMSHGWQVPADLEEIAAMSWD